MAQRRDFLDKAKNIHPDLHMILTPLFARIEALELAARGVGTVTAPLSTAMDANSNRIHSVADPTDSQDAVNLQSMKKYVDAAINQRVP